VNSSWVVPVVAMVGFEKVGAAAFAAAPRAYLIT